MYYCFFVSHLCRYTFGRSYSEKAEVSLFMKLLQEKDNALGQLTVSLEREAQKQSQLIFNMFYYTMCFITQCVLLHSMFYYTICFITQCCCLFKHFLQTELLVF